MPSKKKKKGTARSSNNKKNESGNNKNKNVPVAAAVGGGTGGGRDSGANNGGTRVNQQQRSRITEEIIRLKFGEQLSLQDFPMSKYFVIGQNLYTAGKKIDAAQAYKQGAESDGCVWCMFYYALYMDDMVHLAVPYYLECAIRGHIRSMDYLREKGYKHSVRRSFALNNFWMKIRFELDPTSPDDAQERRKEIRRDAFGRACILCGRDELPEHHLCEGCRCISFCCKSCQRDDWKTFNHRGECRQLKILKHHYRKHAKQIRTAITSGTDPKTIKQLQTVRTKLGLNRPEEEYKDLVRILNDDRAKDETITPNRYEYLTGRQKDGTVHIGSTSNTI